MSPVNTDTSFIENRAPNVAVQFRDRVHKSPSREAYRYPAADGQPWTSITWKETGDTGREARGRPARARPRVRAARRHRRRAPGSSGSSPTSRSCARAARPPRSTRRRTPRTSPTSSPTPSAASSSPRTTSRSPSSGSTGPSCPTSTKVVLFDGAADGDWVIGLDDLSALGEKHLAENPDAVDEAVDAIEPDQLATLIYTSGTTGKPKGVRLRHSSWTYEGAAIQAQQILDRGRPAVPVAADVALVRQGAALHPARVRLRDRGRRPDRQDHRQPRRREADLHGGRAADLREGLRPHRHDAGQPRAARRRRSSTRAFAVGRKVDALKREGKSVPLPLKLQHALFDRLVFSKIRDRFGGRVRYFISGAAALAATSPSASTPPAS